MEARTVGGGGGSNWNEHGGTVELSVSPPLAKGRGNRRGIRLRAWTRRRRFPKRQKVALRWHQSKNDNDEDRFRLGVFQEQSVLLYCVNNVITTTLVNR